ncbi:MAG: ABC transporter permease, partial [Saprospiraceae bacterium]
MFKNYLKIAWRNITRNKGYSAINISGLAVGLTVAMLIGLWILDELSFDTYHQNYSRIAQVMQNQSYNGVTGTEVTVPPVIAAEIRKTYGSDFKYVLQSSWPEDHIFKIGDKRFTSKGHFIEPEVAEMLSLKMLEGTRDGLKEPYSVLLSATSAKAYFNDEDPLNKMITLDNKDQLKVTGVYEDLPYNSTFRDISFFIPWQFYLIKNSFIQKMDDPWSGNFELTFAQIADHADMDKVSAKIKDVKLNKVSGEEAKFKPEIFLHPMSSWHLKGEFKDGKNIGGRIEFVWLFGIIGIFVLLLACINFMNLATARSEQRAKEVGIRKAIGSLRSQLIGQFFSESFVVVACAFVFSMFILTIFLPYFNILADKKISIVWSNPVYWMLGIGFSLFTGFIAGSYPALYLSSFQPVKVLKGTFSAGRFASLPRKVLVVLQFTVSITMVIGTIVVFRQIEFAQNRPVGYNRDGLVMMNLSGGVFRHIEALRNELKNAGVIEELAVSHSPATAVWNSNGGFEWEGMDPNLATDFPNNAVSYEFGKTIGWTVKEGRDFSRNFSTDSLSFIINESAAKYIGFKDPVGKTIKRENVTYKIIGVVKDLVVQSPYDAIQPSVYHLSNEQENIVTIRLSPNRSVKESLSMIETLFKKYSPEVPFSYKFIDDEYSRKFGDEQRIGKLATLFAVLAIFISLLGLFGLASFVASKRTKEIGVRKVIGASVINIWKLLSRDFLVLVLISCLIAGPIAYYSMNSWLQKYTFRTGISWWVFGLTAAGAMLVTLMTVSFQAIKAAIANP